MELKKCFCGSDGHVSEETREEGGTIMRGHVAWCDKCGRETDLYVEQYDAIVAWNARAGEGDAE